jgi:hypothetical protein
MIRAEGSGFTFRCGASFQAFHSVSSELITLQRDLASSLDTCSRGRQGLEWAISDLQLGQKPSFHKRWQTRSGKFSRMHFTNNRSIIVRD